MKAGAYQSVEFVTDDAFNDKTAVLLHAEEFPLVSGVLVQTCSFRFNSSDIGSFSPSTLYAFDAVIPYSVKESENIDLLNRMTPELYGDVVGMFVELIAVCTSLSSVCKYV